MIDLITKTALYFKRTVLIRAGGIGLETVDKLKSSRLYSLANLILGTVSVQLEWN